MPRPPRGLLLCALVAALVGPLAPGVRAARDVPNSLSPAAVAPRPPGGTVEQPSTRPQAAAAAATEVRPRWKRRIDNIVAGRSVGVAVHLDGEVLYERAAKRKRVPASNEKLLVSMTLFEAFERTDRIPTMAAAGASAGGVIPGDLWIIGRGDPAVTGGSSYRKSLPFRPTGLGRLAEQIAAAGITRVTGSVKGSTGYFARDWWAPGWKDYFPTYYIPLPTALTFDGNRAGGENVSDPERRAARSLTKKLRSAGVKVDGPPGMGAPPSGLEEIARVSSAPLEKLIRHMNRSSSNFFAEVLGKRVAARVQGAPGTIANAAAVYEAYGKARNVGLTAYDSSGLSNGNRLSARGLVRLLDDADDQSWGEVLRRTLPAGGQGTLEKRLSRIEVRAKTGTLIGHSALSGYVWLERRGEWTPFSIVSEGMAKSEASDIEDRIVRILSRRAE